MKKMSVSQKMRLFTAIGFAILFLLQILALLTIDVAPNVGDTRIGLSTLNQSVFVLLGQHDLFDKLTDVTAALAILTAAAFAVLGLIQLIKRKSLKKVDKKLYVLAGLYILMAIVYLFFELVRVNYRPVLEDGVAKASFPSSHTLLVTVIMGSAILLLEDYISNGKLRAALQIFCAVIVCFTALGRLASGVHWYTDIIAALLVSGALLSLFSFFADLFHPKDQTDETEDEEDAESDEEEKTKIVV